MSHRITFTAAAVFALLVLQGWLWYGQRLHEDSSRLDLHTLRAISAISGVNERNDQSEALLRGYVLRGMPELADRAMAALGDLRSRLDALRELIADNPSQVRRVTALDATVGRLTDRRRRTIDTRRNAGFEAANAMIAEGVGQLLSDDAERLLDEMSAEEERLLVERQARTARIARLVQMASIASGSAILIFGLLAVRSLSRQATRRVAQDAARLRAEARERRHQELIVNAVADGLYGLDPTGAITFANRAAEAMLGYGRGDLIGKHAHRTIHHHRTDGSDYPVEDCPTYAALMDGGTRTALEEVYWRADGTPLGVEYTVSALTSDAATPLGVVVAFRDVTVRRDHARRLAEAEERFRTLSHGGGRIVWRTDPHGAVLEPIPEWETLVGLAPGESLRPDWAQFIHPDDREQMVASFVGGLESGQPFAYDMRVRRHDGVYRALVGRGEPLRDADGRVREWIGSLTDVTEAREAEVRLRQAHTALREASQEIAEASRYKDEFLANMSHELRTPLNAILGLSESLLEGVGGELTPQQVKSLTTIGRSGEHLLSLINDILDLSKIEAGKIELHLEPLDADEVCQSCLVFVQPQARQKEIEVTFEGVPDATVTADPRRLKQILVNLLSNAVKFTSAGGRAGLRVTADGDRIQFVVWDTGLGIAPEDRDRLFRPFTQIDSGLTRSQEGTGLGLALVSRLVDLHGGSVAVDSEPNRGSRFTVSLPAGAGSSGAAAPAKDDSPWRTPDAREHPILRHALVIEDDKEAAEQARRYLAEIGLEATIHPRGEEAVEAAIQIAPDIIILDIQLPGESGWTTLGRLREHPETRNIPVVVVSIVDAPRRSLDLGAADHLVKPYSREQFMAAVLRCGAPAPASNNRRPVVLLAEDNETNIQTVGGYLEAKHYALRYARNGVEAVALAQEAAPAVILMDIQMPVMDGLAAIRAIRANARLPRMPIVALTALAMAGDRERCLAAGADEYVSKPVRLRELTALIARLVSTAALAAPPGASSSGAVQP